MFAPNYLIFAFNYNTVHNTLYIYIYIYMSVCEIVELKVEDVVSSMRISYEHSTTTPAAHYQHSPPLARGLALYISNKGLHFEPSQRQIQVPHGRAHPLWSMVNDAGNTRLLSDEWGPQACWTSLGYHLGCMAITPTPTFSEPGPETETDGQPTRGPSDLQKTADETRSYISVHLQTFRLQELAFILSWWRSIDGWAPKTTKSIVVDINICNCLEIFPNFLCFFLTTQLTCNGNEMWPKKNRSTKFPKCQRGKQDLNEISYKKFRAVASPKPPVKTGKSWTQR